MRQTKLTPREKDIARCLMMGVSKNRDIAQRLGLKEDTIRGYMARACQKVGARNRTEFAVWALEHLERADAV